MVGAKIKRDVIQLKEEAERQKHMGKKNKKQNDRSEVENLGYDDSGYENPVEYPGKLDPVYVATVDDDELHRNAQYLIDSIKRVDRMNLNSYPWEVELCYIQREMQLRSVRRAAHAEWLKTAVVAEDE